MKSKNPLPIFPLVDTKLLAELFHVRQITIYKWCEKNSIPHYRLADGCLRFDLLEVLKAKKQVT